MKTISGWFRNRVPATLLAGVLLLMGMLLSPPNAFAQGCVASRQNVCVTGPNSPDSVWTAGTSKGESWLSPRRWQLSIDYRYFHSHRHFVGSEEQHERAEQHTEVNNVVHSMNVAGTYEVNPRFSLTASVPVYFSSRFRDNTPNQVTHARGIGDISLAGRMWLLRNPSESRQNVAVGVGVKLPTGKKDVTDTVNTAQGPVTRFVDQSIQPGDGGYGLILDVQAYKAIKKSTLYASGLYLINPRNTNGVPTGRSRPSESIMSVADQYVYRAGAVFPFPKSNTLVWSMGVRGEGVPSTDLIGKSDGFRRPGYIISIDPGFIYTSGKGRWYLNLPIAVNRSRTRSVPDIRDNAHGDAAFADYTILVGYSRRF
jgi:hypothetical protein